MRRFALVAFVGIPLLLGLARASEMDPDRAVEQAKAAAGAIPEQANALMRLAWLDGAPEAVRQRARKELAVFGEHGMDALWKAAVEAPRAHKAEVVETLLAASRSVTGGIPPSYLPALEDSVWFGTRDARLLAIPELGRMRSFASVLPIIDAAVEDPEVAPVAVETLGRIGDPRARFYLSRALTGDPRLRNRAAVALSRLGGEGRALLKSAMTSPEKDVRLAAVRSLLPVATDEDVTALHEYAALHEDDDPSVCAAVREAAIRLERLIETRQAEESAAAGPR